MRAFPLRWERESALKFTAESLIHLAVIPVCTRNMTNYAPVYTGGFVLSVDARELAYTLDRGLIPERRRREIFARLGIRIQHVITVEYREHSRARAAFVYP